MTATMWADKNFLLPMLELLEVLEYAADNLKSDKEVALAAVRESGSALQHASDNLKSNKEVVLAAVRMDGNALQYASDQMRSRFVG